MESEILPYIQTVSEMRIQEFESFPYLYKGNFNYEKEYMIGFSKGLKSCLGVAKIDNHIVGICTGMPLQSDADILKDAELVYRNVGHDPGKYYYFGEFIVLPKYRGFGISRKLSYDMEKIAQNLGYHKICLLTVVRNDKDPRKPKNYKNTDYIWESLGYKPDNLTINYHWPTILQSGEVVDDINPMQFWSKNITNNFKDK